MTRCAGSVRETRVTMSETIVITGAENIEAARWLAVRQALKLVIRGVSRHGRSVRTIANEITGEDHKTYEASYRALDNFIGENLGEEFLRPL